MYASLNVDEMAHMKMAGMQLDHAPGDEMALHALKEVNEPLFNRVMKARAQMAEKVTFCVKKLSGIIPFELWYYKKNK